MKLLITEPTGFSKKASEMLSSSFDVIKLNSLNTIHEHLHTVDVLFIRLGVVFDKVLLEEAKQLKIICTPTTGLDHIDLEYCKARNIKLISLKGEQNFLESIPSTAEHAWTLLMALNRKIYHAVDHVNEKQWDRNQFKSFNLKNKTLGILGLGRVGKQMAEYGQTFAMKVLGYDTNPEIELTQVENPATVEDLFSKSDFISIHIPLNDSTIKFVNSNLISLMKPNACIINTSRGKIWDEESIAEALLDGKIRGVATDVIFDELSEDWQNSPILKVDPSTYNCIVTPHIAGATFDSMRLTEEFIAEKLLAYAN